MCEFNDVCKTSIKNCNIWSYAHFQKKFLLFQNSNFDLSEISLSQLTRSNWFLFCNVFRKRNFNSEVGIKFLLQKVTQLPRKEVIIDQRTENRAQDIVSLCVPNIEIIVAITFAQKIYINNYLQSKN